MMNIHVFSGSPSSISKRLNGRMGVSAYTLYFYQLVFFCIQTTSSTVFYKKPIMVIYNDKLYRKACSDTFMILYHLESNEFVFSKTDQSMPRGLVAIFLLFIIFHIIYDYTIIIYNMKNDE